MQKIIITLLTLSICACSQVGSLGGLDVSNTIGAGADAYKAASLSDKDVQQMALQFQKESDGKKQVAPASSVYAKRLANITAGLAKEDNLNLNYKVYLDKTANAFSLADGTVRFNSALMDLMTDDELRFVLGHEIGHIKEGHSKAKIRTAYALSAARKGGVATASQSGSSVGYLAASAGGELLELVLNSQFSKSEEDSADDYGMKFLKRHKYNQPAAVSALSKLGKLSKGNNFLSSHPSAESRAERMQKQVG